MSAEEPVRGLDIDQQTALRSVVEGTTAALDSGSDPDG